MSDSTHTHGFGDRHEDLIRAAEEQFAASRHREARPRGGDSTPEVDDSTLRSVLSETLPGYEIIDEVHRGGQGVVFKSIQRATRREVAVKVMREGPFAGPRDKARFEREVQILGQLKHPNIVTIHDSGSSAGNFFFVMDYISGSSLDDYVAECDLTIGQTLELFAKVCDAVTVAHLRGVIHRDLKPSNIRVDRAGEPHVLDFGLAKVGEYDVIEQGPTEVHTVTGQFVGSLPWASPEQVEGRAGGIDVRSDVYSLGVMLYQLLTRRFPYVVVGPIRDVLENICNLDPPPPSSHRRGVGDEVDAVVLKCLRKDREARYQSAGELGREIRRLLAGEPIEAKRASGWYLVRKTVRRHRVAVTIGALIVSSLVGLAVVLAVANQRERTLREQAEAARIEALRQRENADAVVAFLERDVLSSVDPYRSGGRDVTVREMFDQAAERIDRGSLALNPEVEGRIRSLFGMEYIWLAEYSKAMAQLQKAVDLLDDAVGPQHEETLNARRRLADTMSHLERHAEAESILRQVLAVQEEKFGPEAQATLLTSSLLAAVCGMQEKYDEAEQLYRETLDVRMRVDGLDSQATLVVMSKTATTLLESGKFDEGEEMLERALQEMSRFLGKSHPETHSVMKQLARLRTYQGRQEEAEALARDAWEGLRDSLGADHENTLWSQLQLVDVLVAGGEHAEAEQLLREALKLHRESGDENQLNVLLLKELAKLLNHQGRPGDALALFREAIEFQRRFRGDSHASTIGLELQLGIVLNELGLLDEEIDTYVALLERCRELYGNEHGQTLSAINICAMAFQGRQDWDEALRLSREAYELESKLRSPDTPFALANMVNVGLSLNNMGRHQEAEQAYRTVIENGRVSLPKPILVRALHALASVLNTMNREDEAEPFYREALEESEQIWPQGHYLIENFRVGLAICLAETGRSKEAEPMMLLSYDRMVKALPEGHRFITDTAKHLFRLYRDTGRPDEAARWFALLPPEIQRVESPEAFTSPPAE